jgi:hypothetical protein
MKKVELWKGGDQVTAYQDADLLPLQAVFKIAEDAWHTVWVARGCIDEGSCILGVGISIWYLAPGKRKPERLQVVRWKGSQGDFEASRLKSIPMDILSKAGLEPMYDAGVMD